MSIKWKKTNFFGVRYREHSSRKHGGNRPDKCFYIHYKVDGKTKDEAVGWSSEGVTAERASKILAQLRENIRLGTGPKTLAELKKANEENDRREQMENAQAQSKLLTFGQFWESEYFPHAKATKKDGTIESERWLYTKWIRPSIGQIPLHELSIGQLENIVLKANKSGKSPATIRYILAVVSQVWNKAELAGIVQGECPVRKIKKPRADNRRMRFLTQDEAKNLLEHLSYHSKNTYAISLVALTTGMRAGEIHGLTWGCIDFINDTIKILDTKNKTNRYAFMTPEVKSILTVRYANRDRNPLVFPNKYGQKRRWVSDTFERVVNQIGLNDSGEYILDATGSKIAIPISDPRHRVVFHTLRHTFASWLVQKGVPLYSVAELMGHSTIEMTKRYSHLAPDSLRSAANLLAGILN